MYFSWIGHSMEGAANIFFSRLQLAFTSKCMLIKPWCRMFFSLGKDFSLLKFPEPLKGTWSHSMCRLPQLILFATSLQPVCGQVLWKLLQEHGSVDRHGILRRGLRLWHHPSAQQNGPSLIRMQLTHHICGQFGGPHLHESTFNMFANHFKCTYIFFSFFNSCFLWHGVKQRTSICKS